MHIYNMNILKLKSNHSTNIKASNLLNYKGKNKYFIPSNNEWYNSTYSYNTNNIKTLPILDKISFEFIKIYFNMYNLNMERKLRLKKLSKKERLISTRRVWINKFEVKHTNDKVIINIHLFDRNYNIFSNKLNFLLKYKSKFIKNNIFYLFAKGNFIIDKFKNDINKINNLFTTHIKKYGVNTSINTVEIQKLNEYDLNKKFKQLRKTYISDFLNKTNFFFKDRLKKSIKILYHIEFIKNNVSKYKIEFLTTLQKIIGKLYKKKVIFNIILLKNFYLNSEILTQIITHVSKDRNNRIYWTLKKTLTRIKIPLLRKNIINKAKKEKYIQNIFINDKLIKNGKINPIIQSYFHKNNENTILNHLNNKSIIGVRIESAGRLTRRFTAQRAVKKVKYIGTIKNLDSSLKGLSTKMVRNNISSSLQYSKNNSHNRIGSFGIKGWINSA